MAMSKPISAPSPSWLRTFAVAGLVVLAVQIALGGWTSSNYAALACPDFPTCQNSYWPNMDAKDAFVLWRGLGIDYEGGVLQHPARVAIHFVHRLGAMVAGATLILLAFCAFRFGTGSNVRKSAVILGLVLIVQLILGPAMVIHGLPLPLATAHNGVAALLLWSVLRLNRQINTTTPASASNL
jgi:cytochrome c oxidase assembly protein subunit 15